MGDETSRLTSVRNVRNVVDMANERDYEGATAPHDAELARAKRGDSPWLTIGERIALANAELAALERPDPAMVVDVVAEGLRVLRTRDGVALTEDMILERARNIAAGLTGVRLDGVRFAARRAPTAEDEANAKEVIR